MKTVTLEIPTTRDEAEIVDSLRRDLALALYRDAILSLGRAAELAGIGRWEFGDLAKSKGIATPYTSEMLEEDFAHGRSH